MITMKLGINIGRPNVPRSSDNDAPQLAGAQDEPEERPDPFAPPPLPEVRPGEQLTL